MILNWLASLPGHLLAIALALLFGATSCYGVRYLYFANSGFFEVLKWIAGVIGVCCLFGDTVLTLFILIGIGGSICIWSAVGTLADRAALPQKTKWSQRFWRMLWTNVLCWVCGTVLSMLILAFLVPVFIPKTIGVRRATYVYENTFVASLVLAPTVVLCFEAMLKNLALRPGAERHFEADEDPR